MDYKIVFGKSFNNLEDGVNAHLQDGWEPIGSPILSTGGYIQALIKKEPKAAPRKKRQPSAGAKLSSV